MTLGCSRCPGAELPSGVHGVECKGLVRPGNDDQMTSGSTLFSLLAPRITSDLTSCLFTTKMADSWQLTMKLSRQGPRFSMTSLLGRANRGGEVSTSCHI